MTTSLNIIVSNDNEEAEQFASWLIKHGHSATIGNSTGNYVNGAWTSSDSEANEAMRALWDAYCNA
jgi:hypothetical protein